MLRVSSGENLQFDTVIASLKAANRHQVIEHAAKICAAQADLDAGRLLDKLIECADFGLPAIGGGVALFHCQMRRLTRPYLFFAHLEQPVDFRAEDKVPVDLVALVLSPQRERGRHLHLVSRVTRMMGDPLLRARLREAKTKIVIAALLEENKKILQPFNAPELQQIHHLQTAGQ